MDKGASKREVEHLAPLAVVKTTTKTVTFNKISYVMKEKRKKKTKINNK